MTKAADNKPVECGENMCEYSNQCTATSAGFNEDDCCPKTEGPCTMENDPVLCDGKCAYGSQSCADAAGFSESQCCKQPKDDVPCSKLN